MITALLVIVPWALFTVGLFINAAIDHRANRERDQRWSELFKRETSK